MNDFLLRNRQQRIGAEGALELLLLLIEREKRKFPHGVRGESVGAVVLLRGAPLSLSLSHKGREDP
jgi:hypothetical protein